MITAHRINETSSKPAINSSLEIRNTSGMHRISIIEANGGKEVKNNWDTTLFEQYIKQGGRCNLQLQMITIDTTLAKTSLPVENYHVLVNFDVNLLIVSGRYQLEPLINKFDGHTIAPCIVVTDDPHVMVEAYRFELPCILPPRRLTEVEDFIVDIKNRRVIKETVKFVIERYSDSISQQTIDNILNFKGTAIKELSERAHLNQATYLRDTKAALACFDLAAYYENLKNINPFYRRRADAYLKLGNLRHPEINVKISFSLSEIYDLLLRGELPKDQFPKLLTKTANWKQELFNHILLNVTDIKNRIEIWEKILNPNRHLEKQHGKQLVEFFWAQRGSAKPSLSRGILAKVFKQLKKDQEELAKDSTSILSAVRAVGLSDIDKSHSGPKQLESKTARNFFGILSRLSFSEKKREKPSLATPIDTGTELAIVNIKPGEQSVSQEDMSEPTVIDLSYSAGEMEFELSILHMRSNSP